MRVPAYLVRSRHGIYYFRWPIPQSLHPLGKASDIKVSLRARDPREALRMSRYLGYVADTLIERAVASEMRYDEIRGVIKRHFKAFLDKKKDEIGAHGRLSEYDLSVLSSSLSVAEMPVGEPRGHEVADLVGQGTRNAASGQNAGANQGSEMGCHDCDAERAEQGLTRVFARPGRKRRRRCPWWCGLILSPDGDLRQLRYDRSHRHRSLWQRRSPSPPALQQPRPACPGTTVPNISNAARYAPQRSDSCGSWR